MKSFKDMFEDFRNNITEEMIVSEDKKEEIETPKIKSKITPEKILRKNDVKIKLINPTSFGTEIILAKHYDEKQIKSILKDYNIKIKNNNIFVIAS